MNKSNKMDKIDRIKYESFQETEETLKKIALLNKQTAELVFQVSKSLLEFSRTVNILNLSKLNQIEIDDESKRIAKSPHERPSKIPIRRNSTLLRGKRI